MTQEQKAQAYDEYVRLATILQNENSRLKSMNPINLPEESKKIIEANQQKINELEKKLQNLFK
jgi:hypothetical protein